MLSFQSLFVQTCKKEKLYHNSFCSRKCGRASSVINYPCATKIDWNKVDLYTENLTKSLTEISKDLGVSTTTIKKRMLKLGIKPKFSH